MHAGIPMLDFVCAVTGGVHSTISLLDLTLLEENDIPNVTIAVMPKSRKVSLVTMETRLHVDRFEELFRFAIEAAAVVHDEMKTAILERSSDLMRSIQAGSHDQVGSMGVPMNE